MARHRGSSMRRSPAGSADAAATLRAAAALWDLPPDAPVGDKDTYIDAVIERARALLGVIGVHLAFVAW